MENIGTVVRGIKTPIIKEGDNLEDVVVSFLEQVVLNKGLPFDTNDNN